MHTVRGRFLSFENTQQIFYLLKLLNCIQYMYINYLILIACNVLIILPNIPAITPFSQMYPPQKKFLQERVFISGSPEKYRAIHRQEGDISMVGRGSRIRCRFSPASTAASMSEGPLLHFL